MKTKRWVLPDNNTINLQEALYRNLNIHPVIADILINRGIDNPVSAGHFLYPALQDMHDPFMMKDMDKAVSRIAGSIIRNEKICVYGDYDVDGITGTSLLIIFFREIGIHVSYYIPDRMTEGYGIKAQGIKRIMEQGANLIITVDCGIDSYNEVNEAKKSGMDMIVTDHHQIPDRMPDACAVLNPARSDCDYPCKYLSGVGIVYKLIKALRIRLREEEGFRDRLPNLKKHLDLVAMGTIADIVPFKEENRVFIRYGLSEIEHTDKVGLRALKSVSDVNNRAVDVYDVGFLLAPRINASGRISKPENAVDLLTSDDRNDALKIAYQLDRCNKERQSIQKMILTDVKNKIAAEVDMEKEKVIVLSSDNWHPGIIGIAASKIIDEYYRPTVLISMEGDKGRGSARSISPFHIYEGLKECSHLLDSFGGHRLAAGLNIKRDNIAEFKRLFNKIVKEKICEDDFIPEIKIDSAISLKDLDISFVKNLDLLKPYGPSNPQPIFLSVNVSVKNYSIIGKNNSHLKFTVTDNINSAEVIGFDMAYMPDIYNFNTDRFDILYTPQLNEWNGIARVQLKLKDIRPAKSMKSKLK